MNSKYYGSMGFQRLIKQLKTDAGGGELTADSVDSVHILNGAVDTDEINDGSITIPKLAPDLVAVIQEIANRIMALEQTAVLRTFDTIVGDPTPIPDFVIPIDLVNNESVEITLIMKIFGANQTNLRVGVNSVGLINNEWDEFNGNIRAGSGGSVTNTPFNKATHNGGVLIGVESQGLTAIITMKVYRSYTPNTVSSRYHFESKGVYCKAGIGVATVDTVGMTNDQIPTGLFVFFASGAATTMTASYSIINDVRRTEQKGPLL